MGYAELDLAASSGSLSGSGDGVWDDDDGKVIDDDEIEKLFENSKVGIPLNAKYQIEGKAGGRLMADYLERVRNKYGEAMDVDQIREMVILGQIVPAKKIRGPAAANQKPSAEDPRLKEVMAWADQLFTGLASWRDKPEDRIKTLLAVRRGVRYLTQKDKRAKYLIQFKGNIQRGDQNFDTKELRAKYKKNDDYLLGEVIWVMDKDENFYSHIAKIGRMHHSSFLAGGEIRAAGDWVVENGKIKSISGRSGHYKPDMTQFLGALKALEGKAAITRDDKVLMVWDNTSYDKQKEIISFNDLLWCPDKYRPYDPNAS